MGERGSIPTRAKWVEPDSKIHPEFYCEAPPMHGEAGMGVLSGSWAI